ncbi:hypothetical protein [Streptomyces sp. NPDC017988]|uniref:hypothetical protein n=1 Tax=Streptomyces sp. NPDC017988 TaxID=3365025 RepID=UPI0037A0C218
MVLVWRCSAHHPSPPATQHRVNHAQVEQSRQLREAHEQQLTGANEPFEPTLRRINHALVFRTSRSLAASVHALDAAVERRVHPSCRAAARRSVAADDDVVRVLDGFCVYGLETYVDITGAAATA